MMENHLLQEQAILAKKVSLYIDLLFDEESVSSKNVNFSKKGKPIALLFDGKSAPSKTGNFSKKGKPIALLLMENQLLPKQVILAKKASL